MARKSGTEPAAQMEASKDDPQHGASYNDKDDLSTCIATKSPRSAHTHTNILQIRKYFRIQGTAMSLRIFVAPRPEPRESRPTAGGGSSSAREERAPRTIELDPRAP